jgi:tetratricopeptide (TPR) repeat protein
MRVKIVVLSRGLIHMVKPLSFRRKKPYIILFGTIIAIALWAVAGQAIGGYTDELETEAADHLAQGLVFFRQGAFERAISHWSEAARLYEKAGKESQQGDALARLARAYQSIGHYKEALQYLETAQHLAHNSGDRQRIASVLGGLGRVYMALGDRDRARHYLDEALALARELDNVHLVATILNDSGNLLTSQGRYDEALEAYLESIRLAKLTDNQPLAAIALINAAKASLQKREHHESKSLLDQALERTQGLEDSHQKAYGLINIGLGYLDLRPFLSGSREPLTILAAKVFDQAASVAEGFGDQRAASYAWGYLGGLYEDEQRYEEALRLTRRAIFAAQQANAPESLFRWHWQTGRLLKAQGKGQEAIPVYRRAVSTLQSIRQEMSTGHGRRPSAFRETVGALYFELVDLLISTRRGRPLSCSRWLSCGIIFGMSAWGRPGPK